MNDMLQLIDLAKSYNRRTYAVKGLSVEVKDGHILALLGHNGAGKSTTLKMVSTMLEPTTGQVLIDGINLFQTSTERLRQIKRKIGFVSETTNLLSYLTAWEYLFYIGQMYGIDDDRFLRKRIDELVEQFVITGAEEKYIDEYSSGLKKRISIASMMVNTPTLLLLDEPTAHLDPIGVKMLKDYLKELRSGGNTVVLATHNLDVAEQLADEILIINEGEKMFYGTLDDMSRRFETSDGKENLESFYSKLMAN
jgi:ABC-2 type transport system ATP-binding protein